MKEEWMSVLQSTWIKVVLVAIVLIPMVYAGVFLGSMWDPYGNADSLPVAVVNQDEEVTFQSQPFHIGRDVVANLKKNSAMDFQFVKEAQANKGLQDGKYYMVITIPKDFSKYATTLLDESPNQMVLHYTTNPGRNYIASKMDETAMQKIKEQVSASVSETYANTIFSKMYALQTGLKQAGEGSQQLYTGSSSAVDGTMNLQEHLLELSNASLRFVEGTQSFQQGVQSYVDGATRLQGGFQTVSSGIAELQRETVPLKEGIYQLQDGSIALYKGVKQHGDGIAQVATSTHLLSATSTILMQSINHVSDSSTNVLHQLQTMSAILASNTSDTQKLSVLQTMLNGTASSPGAVLSMSTLDQGINAVDGLRVGLQTYTEGVKQVDTGLQQVNTSSLSLQYYTSQLMDGSSRLAKGMPTLTSGMQQLQQGANAISDGASALISNNGKLLTGMAQLQSSSNLLRQGSVQLEQGSQTLGSGIQQLHDGTATLNTALQDGIQKSDIRVSNKTSAMFAQPVRVKQHELSKVETNGKAMAPYMMSVGLYVACMAFTLVYPLMKNNAKTASGFQLWMSKAGVMYSVSTIMALLMVMALTLVNGLSARHLLATCGMACLVSAAFMTMIVFFNITLGKVGAFLVLVFMVFQLGGAAGTYPIETSSGFYQAIHPFMPFTYSVDAFRNTLSMSNFIQTDILVFSSMIIAFSIGSICFYQWYVTKGEEHFLKTHLAQFH